MAASATTVLTRAVPRLSTPAHRVLQHWQRAIKRSEWGQRPGIEDEVRWAFQHILNQDAEPRQGAISITPSQRAQLRDAIQRLHAGEPLPYILRSVPYANLPIDLDIEPPILIPRPETEEWSTRLAIRITAWVDHHRRTRGQGVRLEVRILDLCSGSGCIALVLAHRLRTLARAGTHLDWSVLGCDISTPAIALATRNAIKLGLSPHQVRFQHADLFSDTHMDAVFEHAFPYACSLDKGSAQGQAQAQHALRIVVSNPPYIPPHEYAHLEPSVRDWEDQCALLGVHPHHLPSSSDSPQNEVARKPDEKTSADDDDKAGLTFYTRIAALFHRYAHRLKKDDDHNLDNNPTKRVLAPRLVLEVGAQQTRAVAALFRNSSSPPASPPSARTTSIEQDSWGVERVVLVW